MKKLIFLLIFPIFLFANSKILIINSYHKGYEFSDSIVKGIEEVVYPYTNIDINTLYMDSKRVTSKEYFSNLEKLYSVQLKNREYDLIVAIDRFAYDFVLDVHEKFFKDKPVLAVGIENFYEEKAIKYGVKDKVSALLERRDLKSNVKVIKRLIPNLQKLYIINDKSENALHTEPLIQELFEDFDGDYELIYLKEDDLESLKEKFQVEDENSAALFIRFYKNKDGKLNNNREIENFIDNSKIPIFITDSIFIKKGAVGGRIVDLYRFGKASGEMALDILYGKEHKVVIFKDLNYVFDSKKLEQFILPVSVLDVDYEIVNKRETFYDKNRGFIEVVFKLIPLLLFLILGLIHNIYKRKQTEKELRQRIDFDAVLLNAIDSPIFWQDEKGFIVDSNSQFCSLLKLKCDQIYGCDEIYGKKLEDFSSNPNVLLIIDVLEKYKQNKKENYEFKFYDLSGEKKFYLLKQEKFEDKKSKTEGTVTIFTDVTKEREVAMEKQRNRQFVIQQSKLAEIGEVFSSIAHQWKSPLIEITAIAQELFYTRKCDGCNKNEKEDESFVKDIMNQVTYMTNTINDFQKFIMPSNKKKEFNIYDAVKSVLEIINHNIKYNNIKINIDVKDDTKLNVFGYKNEIMQSFLNIVNNAKDALLEKNDYKNRNIEIKLFNENKYLVITIKDNAGGIDEKSINDIFNPYFTTKENGHGIGLYMSKVIIEDKMGGSISVRNVENGAMFTIRLDQSI
ncbi:ABC transporter substrate binding protein [Arcobacter arenosus]|uniref:sensor histidine kinase n=1 Tax=Arcobacter arenosus TaxID=2576037 RepID=UPI003BAC9964